MAQTPARPRTHSGPGRPAASNSEETRLRILEAAQICFGDYGYKATSNRVVAEHAGVTAGTIYHYFTDKQHLFLSAHKAIQAEVLETVNAAIEGQDRFSDAVQALIDALLAVHLKHPSYAKFNSAVRTEAIRNPEISDALVDLEWRTLYQNLTELGITTGEIRRSDARMVRHVLSLTILGITHVGIELNSTDFAECMRGLGRLYDKTLVAPPTKG